MKIQQIDYSVDLEQVILWQYNNADKLIDLISKKQEWYDVNQSQFWSDWYTNVFDLSTADSFGLSVWSIILGIPYFILIGELGPIWGFNEVPEINDNQNFENGNFSDIGNRIILDVEDQRILLQLRYYQLISRGERLETNVFLNRLFNNPDGPYQGGAWMVDNLDMTITYYFNCDISEPLLNVIKQYEVLPIPAAVLVTDYIVL